MAARSRGVLPTFVLKTLDESCTSGTHHHFHVRSERAFQDAVHEYKCCRCKASLLFKTDVGAKCTHLTHHFHRQGGDHVYECCQCKYSVEFRLVPQGIPTSDLNAVIREAAAKGGREHLLALDTFKKFLVKSIQGDRRPISIRGQKFGVLVGYLSTCNAVFKAMGYDLIADQHVFRAGAETSPGPAALSDILWWTDLQLRDEVNRSRISEGLKSLAEEDDGTAAVFALLGVTGAKRSLALEEYYGGGLDEEAAKLGATLETADNELLYGINLLAAEGSDDDVGPLVTSFRALVQHRHDGDPILSEYSKLVFELEAKRTLRNAYTYFNLKDDCADADAYDRVLSFFAAGPTDYARSFATEQLKVLANNRQSTLLGQLLETVKTPPATQHRALDNATEEENIAAAIAESLRTPQPSACVEMQPLTPTALAAAEAAGGDELPPLLEPASGSFAGVEQPKNLPCGLHNIGQTCYFNSLLQAYLSIAAFREAVVNGGGSMRGGSASEEAGLALIQALKDLVWNMSSGSKRSHSPRAVMDALRGRDGRPLRIGWQQDVTEYMDIFLDQVDAGLTVGLQLPSSTANTSTIDPSRLVERLFYGISRHTLYLGSMASHTTEKFKHIIVDIRSGNLYDALDEFTAVTQVNYTPPGGEPTTVLKRICFESFPPVITFQLQRVQFTQSSGQVKVRQPFDFPARLCLDRYLARNVEVVDQLRVREAALKSLRADKQQQLAAYEKYKDYGAPLEAMLRAVLDHFSNTAESTLAPMDIDGSNGAGAGSLLTTLAVEAERIKMIVEGLRAEVHELDAEIKSLYCGLESHAGYRLHSVLVHDGMAGSGHYYCFLYEPHYNRWVMCSDTVVSVVTEDRVLRDSIGGHGQISAYCLIYVADDVWRDNATAATGDRPR